MRFRTFLAATAALLTLSACSDVALAERPAQVREIRLTALRIPEYRPRVPRPVHRPVVDLSWLDPTRAPDWPLWHCTGVRETGMRWTFTSRSGLFRGFAAIAATTWQSIGRNGRASPLARRIVVLYPLAEKAPPWAQVVVARDVRRLHGSSRWGGLRACGG